MIKQYTDYNIGLSTQIIGEATRKLTYILDVFILSKMTSCRIEKENYWQFALPVISQQCPAFTDVSPTRERKITAYPGLYDIMISCIANDGSLRAELSVSMRSTESSKFFNRLYSNRESIDRMTDHELCWEIDEQSSRVYCRIEFGISDRLKWEEAAEFHGTVCSFLYRIYETYI